MVPYSLGIHWCEGGGGTPLVAALLRETLQLHNVYLQGFLWRCTCESLSFTPCYCYAMFSPRILSLSHLYSAMCVRVWSTTLTASNQGELVRNEDVLEGFSIVMRCSPFQVKPMRHMWSNIFKRDHFALNVKIQYYIPYCEKAPPIFSVLGLPWYVNAQPIPLASDTMAYSMPQSFSTTQHFKTKWRNMIRCASKGVS